MASFNLLHVLLLLLFAPLTILTLPTSGTDLIQIPFLGDRYTNLTTATNVTVTGNPNLVHLLTHRQAQDPDLRASCYQTQDDHMCTLRSFQGFDLYADFTFYDPYCVGRGFISGHVFEHFSLGGYGYPWTVEVDWWETLHVWWMDFSFKYGTFYDSGDYRARIDDHYACIWVQGDRPYRTCTAMFNC